MNHDVIWEKKLDSNKGTTLLQIYDERGMLYMGKMEERFVDEILHAREAAEILEEIHIAHEGGMVAIHTNVLRARLRQWGERRKGR